MIVTERGEKEAFWDKEANRVMKKLKGFGSLKDENA